MESPAGSASVVRQVCTVPCVVCLSSHPVSSLGQSTLLSVPPIYASTVPITTYLLTLLVCTVPCVVCLSSCPVSSLGQLTLFCRCLQPTLPVITTYLLTLLVCTVPCVVCLSSRPVSSLGQSTLFCRCLQPTLPLFLLPFIFSPS